jgi:hypothetical protein
MAWLWLLFPALVLLLAFVLWRTTTQLADERRRLQDAADTLRPVGLRRATGPEDGHR